MTTLDTRRRGAAARKAGYAFGLAVNAVLLYLVNAGEGWEGLPFLTAETAHVVPAINVALVAGLVANLVYLAVDPAWLRNLGDVVTVTLGIVAMWRIWTVYPFDFPTWFNWDLVTRVLLALGMVGSAIAVLVALARLVTGRRP